MADRDVLVNENTLIAIADAIREKNGTSNAYKPSQMPSAIVNITNNNTAAVSVVDSNDSKGGIVKTITAIDIGDTTATAADVAQGKYFYNKDGIKTTGVLQVTSDKPQWKRPDDWPDYSLLNISNEEAIYLTYETNESNSYAGITVYALTNNGQCTVEIGSLNDGVFVSKEQEVLTGTKSFIKELKGYSEKYIVIRISGDVQYIDLRASLAAYNISYKAQSCLEIYGRLPKATSNGLTQLMLREHIFCRSLTLLDMTSLGSLLRIAGDAVNLENVYISGTTKALSLYFAFANCFSLKYAYFNGMSISDLNSAFNGCYALEFTDIEDCNVTISNTTTNNIFSSCRNLKSLDLSNWSINSTGASSAFEYCSNLKKLNINSWKIKGGINNIFRQSGIEELPQADFSEATSFNSSFNSAMNLKGEIDCSNIPIKMYNGTFNYCRAIQKIIMPNTITNLGNNFLERCDSLQEVHFSNETPPTLGTGAFYQSLSSVKVYVPYSNDHSILDSYKNATNWATIADKIVEEESE